MRRIRPLLVPALLVLSTPALAQKRALTQADWDLWKSISAPALSNDGKWAIYSLAPLVGDGELIVRSTSGSTEYRVARGYLGRPNNVPGGLRPRAGGNPEEETGGPQIAAAQITYDSRHVLALTYPSRAECEAMSRDRRRGSTNLAIVRLADGTVSRVARVRSFRLPRNGGGWVAYAPGDSAGESGACAAGPSIQRSGPPRRRFGSTVVLRSLTSGAETRLADVIDYAFDDSAKTLAYLVVSRDSTKDGAYVQSLATGAVTRLMSGTGDYSQLALDRSGTQVAFLSNRDAFAGDRSFTLYHASLREGSARPAVASTTVGAGLRIAEAANVAFARSGGALLFGIAPPPVDTLPADSLVDRAVFDLWHYKDAQLQPTQRLNAARDRARSFQAIYHLATKRFVRLANDSLPNVSVSDDGRVAIANSRERYAVSSMWGDAGNDVYLIDATTGAIRLLREKLDGNAQLSPDARYVLFYDDGKYFAHAIATNRTVEITAPLASVKFARETHDTPSPAPGWGVAGWTRGDRSVLLYDRYDIWELDPSGVRAPVMVTDSAGRKNRVQLRLALGGGGGGGAGGGFGGGGAATEERGIDPSKPLLLRGFSEDNKGTGFARDQLGVDRDPEIIVHENAAFGTLQKAQDAEQYLVTRGTFVEFPNLYTGTALNALTRVSDANPQQKDYVWGTAELVSWHSADGVPLKGVLFKPENFDASKKYPMIVYHYEQLSQNLHQYVAPNGRNVTNPTHYVSNGYLVFTPDIHYEEGYPGPSALKSIVPGVNMLLARGFVDPQGIAIQGQSWGGYQGLYMITQTNIFKAAMLGAPVVNMTSAYGGIRWGSGLARAFQYETGQSRIGKSIWDSPLRYIENSPLFWLDKVQTPVFFMHNDADDAVPWYQGIEAFVALRRLGKEVYLINYNNDVHNPASRANQKDMAMRMEQFFDHHLRGKPAPDWMKKGVPYLAKGRDQVPSTGTAPAQAGGAVPEQR
jgi:dipeptidyl aminopeptidase/acylaminoacyl peptidase